ncbi:tetratricopeptide repeat protein, partial [Acidobacteriota bacterium]
TIRGFPSVSIKILAGGGGAVTAADDPQLQEDLKNAIDLENSRDYQTAKMEFEKILTQQPAHREAFSHLMNVLFELGEIDEAEAASNRMITADPGFALPLMALATVAEKRGDLQVSLTHYRNFVTRSPAGGDDFDLAKSRITEIERKLKKTAARAQLTNQLKQIRADIQAKRFQSAIQKIQQIQSREPDNEEARKLFAQAVAGMARGQILSLVSSYQNAFGKPGIYQFLQNSSNSEVNQRMKDAIDSFYKYYNIYQNDYSNARIEFIYSNRGPSTKATVSFHQKSLARTKAKNEERVAVNGTYEWTVEKINNRWVIQNIVYRPGA